MTLKSVVHWQAVLIDQQATIHDAIESLNVSKLKIVLVVESNNTFLGTITDGDIRRGLLEGLSLTDSIDLIFRRDAFSVLKNVQSSIVYDMMESNKISQIPILDFHQRVVGLFEWDVSNSQRRLSENVIVIMAGGFGTRLRPFTEKCPKPMLLVHGKPILEHIILKAKSEGFYKFIISTHYLGNIIEEYFGKGDKLSVEIDYIRETQPLGTTGALGLIEAELQDDFIVTNGDVISEVNFGDLLDFHSDNSSFATMAVRQHELKNPYGVVKLNGLDITGFEEKPVLKSNINAGIYALSPHVIDFIEKDVYCDMPTLFESLRLQKKITKAFFTHEKWMDIGRPNDLEQANKVTNNE